MKNFHHLRFLLGLFGVRQISTTTMDYLTAARQCIPPLDNARHKGQAGRIGVVGGSLEYTGAPYFAAISALKVGADLVHVFSEQSAAPVIKSYSPELIVHPLLALDKSVISVSSSIAPWLDRLHTVVIGPGLGRNPNILNMTMKIISACQLKGIPLVIDADGLFLLSENPHLFNNYTSPVILTPNSVEYKRLFPDSRHRTIADYGANVSVLRKGSVDEFEDSSGTKWNISKGGSGRRCGGQGDILSGAIAVFLHWTLSCEDTTLKNIPKEKKAGTAVAISCYAASHLVRRCNEKAFEGKRRSMLASDMIERIHEAFESLFGI